MLNPSTIAESLINFYKRQDDFFEVLWLEEAAGSRQELVRDIQEATKNLPMLVSTVASGRFIDPNGISDDLNQVVLDNQAWFTPERRTLITREQKFSLVLVSKRPLGVPQLSSPVSLPEWFPVWPGTLLVAKIKSVLYSMTLSLGAQEIPEAAINNALFALERSLCDRLEKVSQATPDAARGLMAYVTGHASAPSSLVSLILSSRQSLKSRTGEEFRPGASVESGFIVSHLGRIWRDCSTKDRHALSINVAEALGLAAGDMVEIQLSLSALLTRGKEKFPTIPPHIVFSRNLMVAVSDVIQFTNAIHHADEFPQFPAVLTILLAKDLANSCLKGAETIKALV